VSRSEMAGEVTEESQNMNSSMQPGAQHSNAAWRFWYAVRLNLVCYFRPCRAPRTVIAKTSEDGQKKTA
jgi:hypothetical protein